jgi:hypothetical protein
MHRTSLLLLVSILSSLPLMAQTPAEVQTPPADSSRVGSAVEIRPPNGVDPDALRLAREVIGAMGGESAWNDRSWNLAFDFVVESKGKEISRYSHRWNRSTGEYIVSGKNREGRTWQVHFNDIHDEVDRKGTATIDGEPAPDTTLSRLLGMAYARFINDTYWMLMPVKLLDPGVVLRRGADTTIGGTRYDVLMLSFKNVGLTPGDRYLVFINPQTKLVERWHYMLESGREADYLWKDYLRFDPVLIPLRRETPDGSSVIRFDNVRVWKEE